MATSLAVEQPSELHSAVQLDHRDSVLMRISAIIDAFDPATPTISLGRLTERTGLPKSTAYRLAEQLVELRWLERSVAGYRLGMKFFEVGGLVGARSRLRSAAMPHLQELRSQIGHSVHLGVLDGTDVVILAKVWGHEGPMPTWDGGRMPAYCTATGKVLLAYAREEISELALTSGLRRLTRVTVVNPSVLRQQLAKIRETGSAIESEEHVAGLCCAAAPVFVNDAAVAAISVSGPVHQLNLARAAPLVSRCAAQIAGSLRH